MNTVELLNLVREGKVSPEEAAERLRMEPFIDLGFAKADTQRIIRQDAPETIYGAGKTPEQAAAIARTLKENGSPCVMVTRCSAEMADRLTRQLAKTEGVTEALKAADPMTWVGRMNSIQAQVREIVSNELIYK